VNRIVSAVVSAVDACRLLSVTVKLPAATAVTKATGVPVLLLTTCTMTVSVAATVLLVTTKDASAPAARLVLLQVIRPVILFRVTPVDRLVFWVCVPPAPVT